MATAIEAGVGLARTRKQRKRLKRKGLRLHPIYYHPAERVSDVLVSIHIHFLFLDFLAVNVREKRRALKVHKLKERANVTKLVNKYWLRRYDLFSKYDVGIKLDEEGWFSVTPEVIAARQARRCAGAGVVIDAFAGVGGNAIQFAKMCHHVVAIEIDPKKAALAYHNAKIYGVQDHIDFIVGDFFQLAPFLKGDVVFLSPPWGGPSYKAKQKFTLDLLKPKDGHSLFQVAQAITPNIMMFLPRNVDLLEASELSWLSSPPLAIEIEENFVRGFMKGITVYFGNMAML